MFLQCQFFLSENVSTASKPLAKLLRGLSHSNSVLWPLKCPTSFRAALVNRCCWKLLQPQTSCERGKNGSFNKHFPKDRKGTSGEHYAWKGQAQRFPGRSSAGLSNPTRRQGDGEMVSSKHFQREGGEGGLPYFSKGSPFPRMVTRLFLQGQIFF